MKGMLRGLVVPAMLALSLRSDVLFVAALVSALMVLAGSGRGGWRWLVLLAAGYVSWCVAGMCAPGGMRSLLQVLGLYGAAVVVAWPLGVRVLRRLDGGHPAGHWPA